MDSEKVLAQLRKFLLIISAGVFVMTVSELTFLGHWNVTIQFLPFALCALGLIASTLAYFRPSRGTIRFTQWSMIFIAVCSAIGFYEHMSGNFWFWLDIQPRRHNLGTHQSNVYRRYSHTGSRHPHSRRCDRSLPQPISIHLSK